MKKFKLGKKTTLLLALIAVLAVSGYFIYKDYIEKKNPQVSIYEKYSQLETYFISNGYKCDNLISPGASCKKEGEINKYEFYRFDDGFQYLINSKNYKINISSRAGNKEISITTTENSLPGTENNKYYCDTDNNTVLGNIVRCYDSKNKNFENDVYITVIKRALLDVEGFLDNSGMNVNKLINDNKWLGKNEKEEEVEEEKKEEDNNEEEEQEDEKPKKDEDIEVLKCTWSNNSPEINISQTLTFKYNKSTGKYVSGDLIEVQKYIKNFTNEMINTEYDNMRKDCNKINKSYLSCNVKKKDTELTKTKKIDFKNYVLYEFDESYAPTKIKESIEADTTSDIVFRCTIN